MNRTWTGSTKTSSASEDESPVRRGVLGALPTKELILTLTTAELVDLLFNIRRELHRRELTARRPPKSIGG